MAGEGLPFGIRDVKLTPRDPADGSLGTFLDLPNMQKLTFEESEDFEELRGDDRIVVKRGKGPSVSWGLEAGGISLEALVVLNGGTLVVSGTTPAVKKTYTKSDTDQRPEFYAEGQAMSESGGDVHTILYRCKMDDSFSGDFADGGFFITSASGSAIGDPDNDGAIYDFVQNQTAAAIVQPT
jgi:hypothetical protein